MAEQPTESNEQSPYKTEEAEINGLRVQLRFFQEDDGTISGQVLRGFNGGPVLNGSTEKDVRIMLIKDYERNKGNLVQ